jgi:hypothetical protein
MILLGLFFGGGLLQEFEIGDLHLQGQVLHHLSHVPSPFCYRIGSYVFAQASLDHNLPIYTSHIASMTGMYHIMPSLLDEMGSC